MSVNLRPLRAEDGPRVLAWRNSPEVAAYMYSDHQISAAEHARWLAGAVAGGLYWIIQLDGAPVGLANLADLNPDARRCAWAYYLADPATRGRGVGGAVEYIVLQHVFETLKLNKLWCEVLAENEPVWRLHKGFGFTREARLRDHVWKGGRFQDVIGLGVLASDWSVARPACEARLIAKGHDLAALIIAA